MSQIIPIIIPTYISTQDFAPARVLPRLFFYNGPIDCETYQIESGSLADAGIAKSVSQFPYFDNYNVITGSFPTAGSDSLLFTNEAVAYGQLPSASLYTEYWETYISLLYNPRTRLVNCDAIIPLAEYFKMELNDIVQWRGNYYHLRAINEYNLSNGECKLQLLGPVINDVISAIVPTTFCDFTFTSSVIGPGTTTTTTTFAPTTTTTTTVAVCPYSIGQFAEGGVIAYILQSGDPGFDANQEKGLVAAVADASGSWGCVGVITGASGSAIGTGNQNTITIMAACPTAGIAARLCGDLVEGGFSDWYLPSIVELNKLYDNRVAIGGFTNNNYWSSTESTNNNPSLFGRGKRFDNGSELLVSKNGNLRFRAVRSFECPATTTTTTTVAPTTTTSTTTTTTTTVAPCLCYHIFNETAGVLNYEYIDCVSGPLNLPLVGGADVQVCSANFPSGVGLTIVPCAAPTACNTSAECNNCAI